MNDKPAVHSSEYLDRLEEALKNSGMTQTRFGYIHFGDPGFFRRLREGHRLKRGTVKKIEEILNGDSANE